MDPLSTIHTSTNFRKLMVGSTIVLCSVLPTLGNAADPIGVLTLYENFSNGTQRSCSFDLPAAGSGRKVYFRPSDRICWEGDDNNFDAHDIRIQNAPSAMKFLLTTDKHCDRNAGNWVELKTSRPQAYLATIGIDKLTDYSRHINNTGTANDGKSAGFNVTAKKGQIDTEQLGCIEVTASTGPVIESK